jgi:DNA helicase-2/ATP-dependent DNA helicase PcrA
MIIDDLLNILFPPTGPKQLTPKQDAIVRHPNGPAWVLAGPGSGKTEVLTVMVLRLLYVENDPAQAERVPPESIIVTTFTDKAARNLEDRISQHRAKVIAADPSLAEIDISKLRVGTLHGLCNDLLQEFRSPNYQNVRLMDQFEQSLFVREHMSLVKQKNPPGEIAFWQQYPWMFRPQQWKPTYTNPPNRWNSTHALVSLLNRLVEDRVSIAGLKAAGGQLQVLADLYDEYLQHLNNNYRCDFSQLQARFLEFLQTPIGQAFRVGDGTPGNPGIKWVLVDEYQDTNPMQEEIYFQLADQAPHNLIVVGDDDQAMYRFRGGSVECMVTFDDACRAFLGISKASVAKYDLVDNFRSHPDIVTFFDDYIRAFPVMSNPGARTSKPPINPKKSIPHAYPAVGTLSAGKLDDLADEFALTVRGLIDNGIVNDPSECCLLLKSTKESPLNAGKYATALQDQGLTIYNPRNKAFAEQEEVQGLLGALLAVLDPNRRFATDPANANMIPAGEQDLRDTYDRLAAAHPDLAAYVAKATAALVAHPGDPLDSNLQEIAYYLLSLEPFSSWQQDPVRRLRLAQLTKLLEAYSAMPVLDPTTGKPKQMVSKKTGKVVGLISRGFLRASGHYPGEVVGAWLGSFYHLFLGYVLAAGFDDEEDGDVIVPSGMVPIMTMHQSKGLEFPFVFVGHLGENPKVSASHELETLFSNYPANPARAFTRAPAAERAEMDLIRQYYVAYSRAKYALILLGTNSHFGKKAVPLGPARNWVRHKTQPL